MIYVDSHVHLHPIFNLEEFFLTVLRNSSKLNENYQIVLILTEGVHEKSINRLEEASQIGVVSEKNHEISIKQNSDSSFTVIFDNEKEVIIIPGKQIVTEEDLEVLTFGECLDIPDGLKIKDVLNKIEDCRNIAILPWGFGKWKGKRGKIVESLIRNANFNFFIGDNSGRSQIFGKPELFTLAEKNGKLILPGTDPLNIKSEITRVGSNGIVLNGKLNPDSSIEELTEKLKELDKEPRNFVNHVGINRFIVNQFRVNIKKRIAIS